MTFGTFAAIVRRGATGAWHNVLALHTSGGTAQLALEFTDTNVLAYGNASVNGLGTTTFTSTTTWYLIIAHKATGTATPRFHIYNFTTDSWVHEDAAASIGNGGSVSGGTARFGEWGGVDDYSGEIAVAGCWSNTVPFATDAAWEAAGLHISLRGWDAANPSALWVLDQATTGQALGDRTGGGANQSSQAGNTVGTGSVPIFNYGDGPWLVIRPQAAGGTFQRTATPVTAAIQTTESRTATPATAAIQVTNNQRTATPVTAAISTVLTRTATPVTAALATTEGRTSTPVTAALQVVNTRTATPATAAISTTNSRTATPVTAALQVVDARTATPVTASISVTGTLERTATPVTAAIQVVNSRTATPVTAAIQTVLTRTATPATAAISTVLTRASSPVTAALRTTEARTASPVTGAIQVTNNQRTATPVTAAVSTVLTRTASPVTASISLALTRTATPVTAAVQVVSSRTATGVTASIDTGIVVEIVAPAHTLGSIMQPGPSSRGSSIQTGPTSLGSRIT